MKSVTKYIRISPKKLGLVADMIRGLSVEDALLFLEHTPKKAAKFLHKGIQSAASNAESNYNQNRDKLIISKVVVTKGPTLKRGIPVSRGRYHRLNKRSSHLIIELSQAVK